MEIVKFKGINNWNEPIFKAIDKAQYFGTNNHLFALNATEAEVKLKVDETDLKYFGKHFNSEPEGTTANVKIIWSE